MSAQPALLIPSEPLSSAPEEQPLPRGAQILIQALVHEGVDSIFGYPGGAVLHIYDELWRARDRITHYLVRDVRDLGAIVHEAFHLARTGRPGPVVIDIPKDISAERATYSRLDHIRFPIVDPISRPDKRAVSRAALAILQAKRPVMYVG